MTDYSTAQKEACLRLHVTRSGSELILAWSQFVEQCTDGYRWDISEYRNEIRVREDIENLLREESLASCREHADFRLNVSLIDQNFREIALADCEFPGTTCWWSKVVPHHAGIDFAQYCLEIYGFKVEVTE
jgi:hypothetical protein